jgi:hypothetical protein
LDSPTMMTAGIAAAQNQGSLSTRR